MPCNEWVKEWVKAPFLVEVILTRVEGLLANIFFGRETNNTKSLGGELHRENSIDERI